MKRTILASASIAVFALAYGHAHFNKPFYAEYKIQKESKLAKARCAVCHMEPSGGKLNPYGDDLAKAMKAAKTKALTSAVMRKVEALDSDKDGKTNLAELKADSNPGFK